MMRINRRFMHILLLLFIGCVKPYEPEFNNDSANKLVVQGTIGSNSGWQYVTVSRTSPVSDPQYIPVSNCDVQIIDDLGETFPLYEYEEGKYRIWAIIGSFIPGRSYKVKVITPNGEILESAFDKMPEGPEIGDVYYEITTIQTNDPEVVLKGIRFYTDFQAGEQDSRYYRWKLTETWEYRTRYPIEYYYDGQVRHVFPPDSSQMVCWQTSPINEVITLSTVNLTVNAVEKFPLNFVPNTTNQLLILYSLLIEQTALSEDAYVYWNELKLNSEQDGGLYNSQPIAVKGNIENKSHPGEEVLGYFQASTVTTKRIFVEPVEGLEMNVRDKCTLTQLRFGLQEINPQDYPAYLLSIDGNWVNVLLDDYCVLCPLFGGVTQKPIYWP